MISRTRYGDPDEQSSPASIVEMLTGGAAIGLFALCCAERLSVIAERLADSPLIGKTVRAGLELGWSVGFEQHPSADAISGAISDLDTFIGLDRNLGKFHRYLNDTVIAVAYALEAVQTNDSSAAINVAGTTREVYFKLAEEIWPGLNTKVHAASPIMREEASRQVRDAQVIASWGGVVSTDRLAGLRKRAHAEGETLVGLITGDQKDREKDSATGQQPLF